MRLKKLKLAGFKSFVDPTTVLFPSNLVAVVGPNGCGKSNTIDAVRWVMGESSAKNLRGESMTDVIFNGSMNRKPVGQASVELIFDNDEGRLVGEYAAYSEIAIKRIVTREGQSTYYLNGTKCRKKDITDIFLGTGLGPRSYSIIGQGTISRIIEAKPDELRVFLEEAAGISKYKERRRETENRIRHTRENLERINDIREELGKQLERLSRQARAAERYKELKQQERLTKAQWQALRWHGFNEQLLIEEQAIQEITLKLEALRTEHNHCESELEVLREQHNDASDYYHEVQGKYYQVGGEIARLEENLQHQKERRQQLESDLNQAKADWQAASNHYQQDEQAIEQLNEELLLLEPQAEQARLDYEDLQQEVIIAEEKRHQWQQQWDEFNQTAHESSKQAHVEQAKIQHLEQQIQSLQTKIEKLNVERESIDKTDLELELEQYSEQQLLLDNKQASLTEQVDALNDSIVEMRQLIQQQEQTWQQCREQSQLHQAELKSLETIQAAALGKQKGGTSEWLSHNDLANKPRLAECMQVDGGWEKAIELVFGDTVQAVCIDDCRELDAILDGLNQGELAFLDRTKQQLVGCTTDLPPLLSKIQSQNTNAVNLLAGVYAAQDLTQAVTWLDKIGAKESIVTQQGIWLGHGWLRVKRESDEQQSVLAREQQIRQLKRDCESTLRFADEHKVLLDDYKDKLLSQETQREELQQLISHVKEEVSSVNAKLRVKQAQLEQLIERSALISNELEEHYELIEESQQQLLETRQVWQQAMQAMEGDTEKRQQLTEQRESIGQALDDVREKLQQIRELMHDKELQVKTKQSQLNQLKENAQREQRRIESLATRIESLTSALTEHTTPGEDINALLEEKLTLHLELEDSVAQAKQKQELINSQINENEKKRHDVDATSRNVQASLDQKKMDAQAIRVRSQTVIEALQETDFALKELLDEMPCGATEKEWDEQVKELQAKIQRLGAINLAAIDEYKVESERKTYLDEQHDDLIQALETLEAAIHKIDKETRTRFKQTYDQVNEGFKKLFPRLFGGGHAYLELTGEDLLDTGVSVMARPPGKRNSSIHLLSGGEKAMAAVALVFSIFQLNPSPFCMLDEVDAPLDDANVGRFCGMVKEMADSVQFIFITHNKVTMELAQHLSGVTMNEPGVSRIVSVDVDEAISISQVDEVTA
jgi:chromosome segregation protein